MHALSAVRLIFPPSPRLLYTQVPVVYAPRRWVRLEPMSITANAASGQAIHESKARGASVKVEAVKEVQDDPSW